MKVPFEHHSQPVLAWQLFVRRLYLSFGLGAALILVSLMAGMAGYHYFDGLAWIDAYLNAAMILSGMGPIAQPHNTAAKIFAGLYALYSGFAVLIISAVALGPVVHRMLHKLHVDEQDIDKTT